MVPKHFEATSWLDRLATPDEVRMALAPSDDIEIKKGGETSLEIASERGGYVRISAEEFEFLSFIEDVSSSAR
jgi:hypothetical protein